MARHPLRLTVVATVAALGAAACGSGDARDAGPPPGPPYLVAPSPAAPSAPSAPSAPFAGDPAVAAPARSAPARSAPVPSGPPPGASADTVALGAVTASLSWDTRLDRRPNDTVRRLALPWLTPRLRQQVAGLAGDGAPGAEWDDWSRRHARASVAATLGGDDRPADTASTAQRQVQAVVTLHGDGGWTATRQRTLFLRLARTGPAWRVDEIVAAETS